MRVFGRFFNVMRAVGHVEREDGIQHFFVCRLCSNVMGLVEAEEGDYRLGGKEGHVWHWTPSKHS